MDNQTKELYQWVKASKDNLPIKEDKMQVNILYKGVPDLLICIDSKWYWFQENIESSMQYPVDKDSWSAIEWLETLQLPTMQEGVQKLLEYFEQQLSLQRSSEIKYTGEEAYFDAVDVCKNLLKNNPLSSLNKQNEQK